MGQYVLDPAGFSLSTFDTAQPSMSNLARPCSTNDCSNQVAQTTVKAASGFLANAREYAELVVALVRGGVTASGHTVMQASDINAILTPASRVGSSLAACSNPGATRRIELTLPSEVTPKGVPIPPVTSYLTETCVAGRYRQVLIDGSDWSGLGVELSPSVEPDGYSRVVDHAGDHEGIRTFFRIDRRTRDGVVIMINGRAKWVDGDGGTYGAEPLMEAIKTAYLAAY